MMYYYWFNEWLLTHWQHEKNPGVEMLLRDEKMMSSKIDLCKKN